MLIDSTIDLVKDSAIKRPTKSFINKLKLRFRCDSALVLGYLIKPIKMSDLKPAITLAMQRAREFATLEQKVFDLKLALEANNDPPTTQSTPI